MNTKDFIRLGVPLGEATRLAIDFISKFILAGGDKTRLEAEAKVIIANPSAFTEDRLRGELPKAPARGLSGCSVGPGSDCCCELFNLALQTPHLLEGPFGKDGEFLWLPGEEFPAQHSQRLVHALQLLHRLGQDGISLVHRRTRNSPFLSSGISRTRLKNSTHVLYSELSHSATITSKPNRRRRIARDTSEYS